MPIRWNAEVMDLQGIILETTFFSDIVFSEENNMDKRRKKFVKL